MDNDAAATVDISFVGDVCNNSTVEVNTDTRTSSSVDIEDHSTEATTVAVKTSSEEQIKTKESVANICASYTNASGDSAEPSESVKLSPSGYSADPSESVKLPPLNNVNDTPKNPSDNSKSTTLLDNCVVNERDGYTNSEDNENASEVSNECSKIANAMENQKLTDESKTEHTETETVSNLNDNTCASVSNEVSEHWRNTINDKGDETVKKSNGDEQFPNIDENCKNLRVESKESSNASNVASNVLVKEGQSVNTVEDIEVVTDSSPISEHCQNTVDDRGDKIETAEKSNIDKQFPSIDEKCNDEYTESSEGLNGEKNSMKQQLSADETIEIIDVESPESRKDLNIESTGNTEPINDDVINEVSKEESSHSNAGSVEVIDVEKDSDKKNEVIEIIDDEDDSNNRKENNLPQPLPIEQKSLKMADNGLFENENSYRNIVNLVIIMISSFYTFLQGVLYGPLILGVLNSFLHFLDDLPIHEISTSLDVVEMSYAAIHYLLYLTCLSISVSEFIYQLLSNPFEKFPKLITFLCFIYMSRPVWKYLYHFCITLMEFMLHQLHVYALHMCQWLFCNV